MPTLRESSKPKPDLNRGILYDHGITFDESFTPDCPYQGLPEHATILADALLEFDNLFSLSLQPELEKNHTRETHHCVRELYPPPPLRCYIQEVEGRINSALHTRATKRYESRKYFERQAEVFFNLEKEKSSEWKWLFMLHNHIFLDYENYPDRNEEFSCYRLGIS